MRWVMPAKTRMSRTSARRSLVTTLGGSFTVYVEGNLFRIAGKDADALGKDAADLGC